MTQPHTHELLRRWLAPLLLIATAGAAVHADDEIGRYGYDPASADVQTNNPANFAGMDIGNFLGANRFYNAGVTGQGTVVNNVEAGLIWNGHQTLTHVTNFTYHADTWGTTTTDLYDRHATWVGMIIGGRGGSGSTSYRQGIAYNTDLRSSAIATSWSGSAYATSFSSNNNTFFTAYNNAFGSADVINSSWGFTDATGTANRTLALDAMARSNSSTVFVHSAGNDGPSTNTVGMPVYNGLNVAALTNGGNNSYNSAASFSSRGPQNYSDPWNGTITGVRSPVDIAAPGDSITTAFYGGQTGGNNTSLSGSVATSGSTLYSTSVQGTSFAAPMVASGAALLDSASKANLGSLASNANSRDARVIKAVLLNSADKTSGWSNGQTTSGGVITTTQSLDYTVGAGRMNLSRAYDQYLSGTKDVAGTATGQLGAVSAIGWDYGVAQMGNTNTYFFDNPILAGTKITITLDWFRDATVTGFTAADIGLANLDLFVFDASGNIVGSTVAQSISTYNNVEHLYFDAPSTGLYGFGVSYAADVFGSNTAETYGLAWSTVTFVPAPGSLACLAAPLLLLRRRRAII